MRVLSLRQTRRMIEGKVPKGTLISEDLVRAMAGHINDKYANKVQGELEDIIRETLDRFVSYNRMIKKWHGDGAERKTLRKEFFEDIFEREGEGE